MYTGAERDSSDILEEASQKSITEFDLVAYDKNEITVSIEKNIMRRMFNSFDMVHSGFLAGPEIEKLCKYLGNPMTNDEISLVDHNQNNQTMTFDEFWLWWNKHCNDLEKSEAFAMISASFSVPYHQRQLIIKDEGEKFTPEYRIKYYFKDMETNEKWKISPWHDIPLYIKDFVRTIPEDIPANKYNFICEIPKWTRAKFEISTREKYNPIKQDIKNGVPRFYKHGDMMWNYGAFPQTWESTEINFIDNIKGDNDPLDCIEIGMTQMVTGSVWAVKILGVLGMIDDGEMDWKIICISHYDPIAKFLNDIDDIPEYLPGCLEAIREWLRVYKICQGGVENKFAFNGEFKNKEYTMKLIKESHRMWKNLRKINETTHFE